MDNSNDFVKFLIAHKGAIIGGLIGIIIAFTGIMVNIIIPLVTIIFGIWAGEYIQRNKEKVKDFLRKLVDKM